MRSASSCSCARTSLHFDSLHEVVDYAGDISRSGYQPLGNWNLGQVCNHLAQTIECSLGGFPRHLPRPMAAVMRWSFMNISWVPKLMRRVRVPTFPPMTQDSPVDDAVGRERLTQAVDRFMQPDVVLQRNPVMGTLTADQWLFFHIWHAEHHLSFLKPKAQESDSCARSDVRPEPDTAGLSH